MMNDPPLAASPAVLAAAPPAVAGHLRELESESIHIIREVAAECRSPVFLYSIGKDSSVLLRLMRKAFHPSPLPFPMLHIDTGWKFKEMYELRDRVAKESGARLIVHSNEVAKAAGVSPFADSSFYTHEMKTVALKEALTKGGYDAAFGGARRDEEKSRAKERVFSIRNEAHAWDPKNQRPEFWRIYNSRVNPGESVRVFPLSNWTEGDIWQYIQAENIPIVPLYFAAPRPVVERDGMLIVVDDADRMAFRPGETTTLREVRFRSLGCWPLTAAHLSTAKTLPEIVAETLRSRASERGGRLIDRDENDSMENKKREGYF